MSADLTSRLTQIMPRITSSSFLSNSGRGNEISCHIFDYPANQELLVRDHLELMLTQLKSQHLTLKVLHLNLLQVITDYLEHRALFEKAIELQKSKGDAEVLHALKGPLSAEKIRDFIAQENDLAGSDLIFISGVGSSWPMLRTHNLLNCLHKVIEETPLVLFYPGIFDGVSLNLFGSIAQDTSRPKNQAYYRAFRLLPEGPQHED